MSKVFKKVGRGLKKVFKGIKKVFKKIVKSKIFKIALAATAIYFGGVALGAWGGSAAIPGTAAVAKWGATTGINVMAPSALKSTAELGQLPIFGGDAAATSVSSMAPNAVSGSLMQGIPQSIGGQIAAGAKAQAAGAALNSTGLASAGGGFMGTAKGLLTNPYFASTLLQGVQAGFTPNPEEQQREWSEEDRARREENMKVGGIDVGTTKYDPSIMSKRLGG
jgi:hypothetical protein